MYGAVSGIVYLSKSLLLVFVYLYFKYWGGLQESETGWSTAISSTPTTIEGSESSSRGGRKIEIEVNETDENVSFLSNPINMSQIKDSPNSSFQIID